MHKEDGADMRTIIKKELPSSGASYRDMKKKKMVTLVNQTHI